MPNGENYNKIQDSSFDNFVRLGDFLLYHGYPHSNQQVQVQIKS